MVEEPLLFQPVPIETLEPILAALDKVFDAAKKEKISEGRRIEFFEGKRKGKDGITRKTGHHYWQFCYTDPDTGKRKRPYGGAIGTVPASYQYRVPQYQAALASRSSQSLADQLLRPALNELRSSDTGAG